MTLQRGTDSTIAIETPRPDPKMIAVAETTTQFMPIPEKVYAVLRNDDRFLVSYPRSGSRWMRIIIADLMHCREGIDSSVVYEQQLEIEMEASICPSPNMGTRGVVPCVYEDYAPTADLSHAGGQPIWRSHNLSQIITRSKTRIVYLFRSPIFALVSYYYYLQRAKHEAVRDVDINEFCTNRAGDWARQVTDATDFCRAAPDRILLVQYRGDAVFDRQQVRAMLSFLSVDCQWRMIDDAIGRFHTFLQRLNSAGAFACRRGIDEDPPRHITRRAAKQIMRYTQTIFDQAVQIGNAQLRERRAESHG